MQRDELAGVYFLDVLVTDCVKAPFAVLTDRDCVGCDCADLLEHGRTYFVEPLSDESVAVPVPGDDDPVMEFQGVEKDGDTVL